MQGKVSMVIPCYNKEEYIGEMFDSIIAQEWDNIELILVNDGSTDGTLEEIRKYEPKFKKRRFEVIIIDQKNAGVCAAAKAGLERITGEYVCMVDADDELDPKYVSTMAGWLDDNKDCDFTACEHMKYTGRGANKTFYEFSAKPFDSDSPFAVEKFILHLMRPYVWAFMVRSEYLFKCRIIETYFIDTKGSHEPGYVIPLLAHKGKMKFFELPLYLFNNNGEGHSRSKQFEVMLAFDNEYDRLNKIAIDSLPDSVISKERKENAKGVSLLGRYIRLYHRRHTLEDSDIHGETLLAMILSQVNSILRTTPPISREMISGVESLFFEAVKSTLVGGVPNETVVPQGRVIGYGALGRVAKQFLPHLEKTKLAPTELWDMNGDGIKVKKPNFDSLQACDLLIVFPVGKIEAEIRRELINTPFQTMYHADLRKWLSNERFPAMLTSK